MAEDWDAADDDLEKLLDFDDLEVPTARESCKTIPSIDAKEDGMESTGKARPVNSSCPQATANTEIVHSYATTSHFVAGREVDVYDSSAIASVPATFVIASRVDRFPATTGSALVRSRSQLEDTQLVSRPNDLDKESFRERNGGVAGDGGYVDTQRIGSASGSEKPDAVPKSDRQRKRIALHAVDSSAEVRPRIGIQDAALAVRGEVAAVRPASDAPDETEISQATNSQGREERSSPHQVGRKDIRLEIAPEAAVGLGTEFNVGSNKSGKWIGRAEQALVHAHTQGTGREVRETGKSVSLQRRLNSSQNVGTPAETGPLVSLPEVPPQSRCDPRKGDSAAYDKSEAQEAGSLEKGSREGLPYRIPGPAGALQENFRKRTSSGDLKTRRRSFGSDSQSDTTEFLETPWITALGYLDNEASNRVPSATIGSIKGLGRHLEHIPELVVIIAALVPNGVGDYSVVLKDPTGTINGCIHRSVLTESKYGHGVTPGAVLILRKVTVFSPNPSAHYLNITIENVHKVFGSEAGNSRPQTRVAREKTNSVQGNKMRPLAFSSDDPTEVLPTTVSISQRVGESVVRTSVEQGKRQSVVRHDANHDDTGTRNHIFAQQPIALGAAKGLPDASLATTLEDRGALHSPVADVNLRNRGGSPKNLLQAEPPEARKTQDAEEKVTQEAVTAAKAKAAGWDLGEDVELLLDDDLSSFLV